MPSEPNSERARWRSCVNISSPGPLTAPRAGDVTRYATFVASGYLGGSLTRPACGYAAAFRTGVQRHAAAKDQRIGVRRGASRSSCAILSPFFSVPARLIFDLLVRRIVRKCDVRADSRRSCHGSPLKTQFVRVRTIPRLDAAIGLPKPCLLPHQSQ